METLHIQKSYKAKEIFSAQNRWKMVVGIVLSIFALIIATPQSLCVLYIFSIVTLNAYMLWKIFANLFALSALHAYKKPSDEESVHDFEIDFTILLPLYKEANIVEQLIRNMNAIRYESVEYLIIVEHDDKETREAVRKVISDLNKFRLIIVPKGEAKTKANACNYALKFAKGGIIGIYDAEDQPDTNQLAKVERIFAANQNNAIVQNKLCFYNKGENLLTEMFEIEYKALFDIYLPFFAQHKLAFPLGGTSNFVGRDYLLKNGGWDSFNVTEDAELGMRLAFKDVKFLVGDSYTYEEAPTSIKVWLNQRTRWIKGYFQTLIQLLSRPVSEIRVLGLIKFSSLLIFIFMGCGGYLLSFYTFVLFSILKVSADWGIVTLFAYSSLVLIVINLLMLKRILNSGNWIWFYPFYFILHIVAAHRALWELVRDPFIWSKTPHIGRKVE